MTFGVGGTQMADSEHFEQKMNEEMADEFGIYRSLTERDFFVSHLLKKEKKEKEETDHNKEENNDANDEK